VVILTASKRGGSLAPVVIPVTLVAIHFAIATVTGSSVNPARSIGSALVGGDLTGLWIYLVGPIVGGIVGWGLPGVRARRGETAAQRSSRLNRRRSHLATRSG
jgi:aquaporin Z